MSSPLTAPFLLPRLTHLTQTCLSCRYRVYSTECTVQSVQYRVYSTECTVHSVQYRVYSIQGASQFVQSIINFLAESPHQDGKACLEGQHAGPPFPTSKHPQVE